MLSFDFKHSGVLTQSNKLSIKLILIRVVKKRRGGFKGR